MDDPNTLHIKQSGGFCGVLFGLPFLAAGIFCMVSPWIPNMKWEGGEPPPLYFIIPFGSIFAFVGGAIVFGRAGVIIEARQRIATTWWGFLVPLRRTHHSIPSDAIVTLRKVRQKGEDSSTWNYEVKIESDFETIDVEANTDWYKSRKRAEQVAKLLGADMIERSQGEEEAIPASDLDKPLSQRIKEAGAPLELPSPPASYRTRIEMTSSGVRFEIPPLGFSPMHVVKVIGVLVLYVFITWFFFDSFLDGLEGMDYWIFFGFSSIFYLVPGLAVVTSIVRDLSFSSVVQADPVQLSVTSRKLILSREKSFRMSEIEDLSCITGEDENTFGKSIPGKRFIRVVSDRGQVAFGRGLSLEELSWIHDVLRYLIAKGS